MRRTSRCFALFAGCALGTSLMLHSPPSAAVYGAADNTPAATVLIPYFEVDLTNTNGRTTLVSLTNASATAILANVVLWSDQAVPVAKFDVYLTGYDMQSLNLRDVLNGNVPRTASAGQDPANTISPKGVLSQDINFASCNGTFPYPNPVSTFPGPVPNPPTPADVRAMLTGQASSVTYSGQCVGTARGDNVARGYITIDTVNQCSTSTPASASYFTSIATFQNVLHADVFYANPAAGQMAATQAPAVESTFIQPVAGEYTFYGANTGFTRVDQREPLPTTWAVDARNRSAELVVWRDPKVVSAPRTCGNAPTYGSLPIGDARGAGSFDPASEPYTLNGNTAIAPNATQRLSVSPTALSGLAPDKLGWVYLSFNHGSSVPISNPGRDPAAAQSYVLVIQRPEGSGTPFELGVPATALDTGVLANHGHPDFPN